MRLYTVGTYVSSQAFIVPPVSVVSKIPCLSDYVVVKDNSWSSRGSAFDALRGDTNYAAQSAQPLLLRTA